MFLSKIILQLDSTLTTCKDNPTAELNKELFLFEIWRPNQMNHFMKWNLKQFSLSGIKSYCIFEYSGSQSMLVLLLHRKGIIN